MEERKGDVWDKMKALRFYACVTVLCLHHYRDRDLFVVAHFDELRKIRRPCMGEKRIRDVSERKSQVIGRGTTRHLPLAVETAAIREGAPPSVLQDAMKISDREETRNWTLRVLRYFEGSRQ